MAANENNPDRPFVISRSFDAPRDLVFKVWTEANHLMRWWGPKGVKIRHAKIDLRPGGIFHYAMENPDCSVMWGKWTFREILPPERLTVIVSFSDKEGGITRHPFAPDWPREMLSTMIFTEKDGKTIVTVEWSTFNATDAERKAFDDGRSSMQGGWTGTFDQLGDYLATAQEK